MRKNLRESTVMCFFLLAGVAVPAHFALEVGTTYVLWAPSTTWLASSVTGAGLSSARYQLLKSTASQIPSLFNKACSFLHLVFTKNATKYFILSYLNCFVCRVLREVSAIL